MKRLFLISVAAFSFLVPAFAAASDGPRLVYRPELRTFVVAPPEAKPVAPPSALTPAQTIARHEAMARAYRVNPRGQDQSATTHCHHVITQAEAAARQVN